MAPLSFLWSRLAISFGLAYAWHHTLSHPMLAFMHGCKAHFIGPCHACVFEMKYRNLLGEIDNSRSLSLSHSFTHNFILWLDESVFFLHFYSRLHSSVIVFTSVARLFSLLFRPKANRNATPIQCKEKRYRFDYTYWKTERKTMKIKIKIDK